jgi:predicted nucleotidyltransferase
MSSTHELYDRVIYRCVIGSRAYGLATDESDTDRRGCYLPPAKHH